MDQVSSGVRIDVFLTARLEKYSRTAVKKVIHSGNVLVNGQAVKANHLVHGGEVITVEMPAEEPFRLEAENIPLDIVYEDEDVVVVNKKPGLVVHPAPGNYTGTLVNALLFHCKKLSNEGGMMRPGIVHRLDKDTSGLIVAAKNDQAHRFLSRQFKTKQAGRVYIALVKGVVQLDNGIIDMPIGRHPVDRKKMDVEFGDGKEAKTFYKVLKRFAEFTVLELRLETGRTHQIRVHLAHLGYPVLGDKTYGSQKGLDRQALHARAISFVHPRTKEKTTFECELPEDMASIIRKGQLD